MPKPMNTVSERDRLASSIAASLPAEGGSYEPSSMFTAKNKRRILGFWEVTEHTVAGVPYLDTFMARTLKGRTLLSPSYSAVYYFKDVICLKKVIIAGMLEHPDEDISYKYVMNIALSWESELGGIRVFPEMGYQYSSLNDEPAAVREMGLSGEWLRIALSFEGQVMVMTEGDDLKKLKAAL